MQFNSYTKILNWVHKIYRGILWIKVNRGFGEKSFLNLLSLVVGLVTGLAAILLKTIVFDTAQFVKSFASIESADYIFFAMPLIGIVLTVLFIKYCVKDSLAHGITKVLHSISKDESRLAPHNNYSSIIASTLTVGFGGSVGLEAPVVLTGSSIGASLARLFNLDYRSRTLLLGCGAAAAIASLFKAPIAGTVFALEVLMLDLSMTSLIPLLISAVSGSIISALLLGSKVVFNFAVFEAFNIHNTPYYLFFGIFCGLIGLYFTVVLEFIENLFVNKIKKQIPKLLIGGVLLGLLIYLLPPLYGEGYETISFLFSNEPTNALNHSYFFPFADNFWMVATFFFLVIIFKAFASALTTGAGGAGGVFGPSLFLGGISGFLFGGIINVLEIGNVSQRNFALVGMAGVLSAVMQSPLTAIFLIAEITGGYALFVPIIITSTIAYITVHSFLPYSIYTKRLARSGELLTHDKDKSILTLIDLNKLEETDFSVININGKLSDLVVEVANSNRNTFVIVDDENNFRGIISLNDVRNMLFESELYEIIKISSIMKLPKMVINKNDSPDEIMKKFKKSKEWNLPVVNDEGKYVGFLSKAKVMTAYRDLLLKVSLK